MREYLRILGNGTLGTAYSDIYQVGGPVSPDDPIGAVPQAVVNSMIFCETGDAGRTVTVRIVPKDVTTITGSELEILHEMAIDSKETRIVSPGITLSSEDTIQAKASVADVVNIFIFGSEIK